MMSCDGLGFTSPRTSWGCSRGAAIDRGTRSPRRGQTSSAGPRPGASRTRAPRFVRAARSCGVCGFVAVGMLAVHQPRAGPLDPVGDQLAVEGRGVDAEDLAGALLLPAGVVQHLEDVLLLELLQRERRRIDDQAAAMVLAEAYLVGQVLGPDHPSLVENQGALDDVLQLAHVPCPVVLHQQLHRLLVDGLGGAALGVAAEEVV